MDEIIDHWKDKHTVTKENRFMEITSKHIPKKTTQGWKLCKMERWLDELGMTIRSEGGTSSQDCGIRTEQRPDG